MSGRDAEASRRQALMREQISFGEIILRAFWQTVGLFAAILVIMLFGGMVPVSTRIFLLPFVMCAVMLAALALLMYAVAKAK